MFFLSSPAIDRPEGKKGSCAVGRLPPHPCGPKNAAWMRHLVGRSCCCREFSVPNGLAVSSRPCAARLAFLIPAAVIGVKIANLALLLLRAEVLLMVAPLPSWGMAVLALVSWWWLDGCLILGVDNSDGAASPAAEGLHIQLWKYRYSLWNLLWSVGSSSLTAGGGGI